MSTNRSLLLDSMKVQARAREVGIDTQAQLETAYANKFRKYGEHRAPKHAWQGKPFATKGVQEMAELLGLESYHELLPDKPISVWAEFVQKHEPSESFSEMVIEPSDTALKGMLDFDKIILTEDIKTVRVHHNFYFNLWGNKGESFIILLSSHTETIQLAPIGIEGFGNLLKQERMRYPNCSLSFDQNRLGWRRFIIIKCKDLSIKTKYQEDGFSISSQELDVLALKLEDLDIMMNIHEFYLVR